MRPRCNASMEDCAVLPVNVVWIAAILGLLGVVPYVRDTLAGQTTPHRVTWGLWAFIPLVTLVVQLQAHVGRSTLMTLSYGVAPLAVLTASFIARRGSWAITRIDWWCAAVSVFALSVYVVERVGTVTVILLVIADAFASIPTATKSYRAPESETWQTFAVGVVASVLTLLTITNWSVTAVALPLYIALMNALIVLLVVTRVGPRLRNAKVAADV
jgi:hypothetical protein